MADRSLARLLEHIRQVAGADGGMGDAQLLERYVSTKDDVAFELLVRRHERLVFGLCRRILPDFHEAEDAFQATFLALARKAHTIAKGQAIASWLYRVAYRIAIVIRAKRAREAGRQQSLTAAENCAAPVDFGLSAESRELRGILDEELNRLPERYRAPLVLCYLEGKTVDDAARQLGWPRGTVASRLARARERLRVRLTGRGLALPGAALLAGLAHAGRGHAATWGLVNGTVRLVKFGGASSAAVGAGSSKIISLTDEVLRAMSIKKLSTAMAVCLVSASVLLLGGGLGMHLYGGPGQEPALAAGGVRELKLQAPIAQKAVQKKEEPAGAKPLVRQPEKIEFTSEPIICTGRLEASRVVEVLARVGGPVANVYCKQGDAVKKGDLLFELDATVFKESLIRAKVNLGLAQARLKQSRAEDDRKKNFFSKGVTANIGEFDKAKVAVEADSAALQLAELDLERATREYDATKVKAPADGTIGKLLVNAGAGITADKTVLTKVSLLDLMHVVFDIDERTYQAFQSQVKNKQMPAQGAPLFIQFTREDGFPYMGKISTFDDSFDPKTGTLSVTGVVPNPDRQFIPGMSARVVFPSGKPYQMLVVPTSAIRPKMPGELRPYDPSGKTPVEPPPFVLIINDGNLVERRSVVVGQLHGAKHVLIELNEKGLRPDDWVVIEGGEKLSPGDRVEPRRAKTP